MRPLCQRLAALTCIACLTGLACTRYGTPKVETVVSRARDRDRVAIVEFSADWCGPCKFFAKHVLPRPDVQLALSGAEFVTYRDETTRGRFTRRRYGVKAFPTFLALSAEGRVVAALRGAASAERFIDFVQVAQIAALSREAIERRLAGSGADGPTLLVAGRWYAERGERKKAIELLGRAVTADDQHGSRAAAAFYRMALLSRGGARKALGLRAAAYFARYPGSPFAERALRVALHLSADKGAVAEQALEAYAGEGAGLRDLAIVLLAQDRHGEALRALDAALASSPPPGPETLRDLRELRDEIARRGGRALGEITRERERLKRDLALLLGSASP